MRCEASVKVHETKFQVQRSYKLKPLLVIEAIWQFALILQKCFIKGEAM